MFMVDKNEEKELKCDGKFKNKCKKGEPGESTKIQKTHQ